MNDGRIKVVIFGVDDDVIFDESINTVSRRTAMTWSRDIAEARPNLIITFGDLDDFDGLVDSALHIRRKWLHFSSDRFEELKGSYKSIVDNFFTFSLNDKRDFSEPLVSVITPTYNTSNMFWPYRSLMGQSYKNWEWIVYDDGSTSEETLNSIRQIADMDPRVQVFLDAHSGVIGEVKKNAFSLANGDYLVELDHDDELLPNALSDVVEAFARFPDSGFCYSDCAEVIGEDHEDATYPDGWGFGYGSYRTEFYRGRNYQVMNYPSVNPKTVRHIVGMPNHVRAWRKSFYQTVGGHDKRLHVADDYEILVRTFLHTRMVHIKRFGYIQYHHDNNAQKARNADIQRLVKMTWIAYEDDIHNRLVQLGVDDFIWRDGVVHWDTENPQVAQIANYEMK